MVALSVPQVCASAGYIFGKDPLLRASRIICSIGMGMRSFLLFRGSRPGLFYDLSTGDTCPLRIPFDRLRTAASPTDKS